MMSLLNGFLGSKPLLPRGSRAADGKQASNMSHWELRTAVQQEVAEHPRRIIILADLLAETKSRLQNHGLLDRQVFRGNSGLTQPLCKRSILGRHSHASLQLQGV